MRYIYIYKYFDGLRFLSLNVLGALNDVSRDPRADDADDDRVRFTNDAVAVAVDVAVDVDFFLDDDLFVFVTPLCLT